MSEEYNDEELNALRQRRLQELQQRLEEAKRREAIEEAKQEALRKILTPEAKSRLANLKMVKPQFAEQIELQLIQLANAGRLPIPLTDEQLKSILKQLVARRKPTRIIFRKDKF